MFEYRGNQYTLEDLQNDAARQGYDFDEYLQMYKNDGMVEIEDDVKIESEDVSLGQPKTWGELGKQFLFGPDDDTPQLVPILGDVRNSAEGVVDFFKEIAKPSEEKATTEIEETDRKKGTYFVAQQYLAPYLGYDNAIANFFAEGVSNRYRSGGLGIESGEEVQPSINVRDADVVTLEKAQAMIDVSKDRRFKEPTDNMKKYQSRYDQVNEEHGGTMAFFIAAAENPMYLADVAVQSMAMMGSSLANSKDVQENAMLAAPAVGLATAKLPVGKNPLGFGIGFMSGLFGSVSGTMDAGLSYSEFLQEGMKEDGLDYTAENIVKYLQNDEVITYKDPNGLPFMDITGTRAEIQKARSIRRGWAIGTVDTFTGIASGGVAKGTFTPKGKLTTRRTRAIKGTGAAIGGGLISEVAGQTLGGQEYHAGEIWTEGLAEKGIAMTGITVVPQLLKNKGTYSIKGEQMSEAKFVKEVNQMDRTTLAMADVKVENDDFLSSQVNSMVHDAYLDSQIDKSIKSPEDRERLIKLQKELNKAKNALNKEKKNKSSAVPGIEDKILGIEKEIEDIIGGHKGAVGIGQTEIAKEVKKERVKVFLKATEKFAEISSEQLDFDPYEAFDTNEDYVSAFVERSMMGMDLSKMSQQEIEAEANRLADEASNSEGVNVITAADGSTKIMINREVAAEYAAMNVGSHEVLHGVMEGALEQMTPENRKKLIKEFKSQIKTNLGQKVLDLVDERLRTAYTDKEGNLTIDLETTSEWFTALSDIVENPKNNITYEGNKGFWNSIKDNIAFGIFRENTPYEKLSIETGEQAFNFMKEYSKSVKEGKLSESMVAFAKGKPQPTKDKADFSRTTERAQQFLDAEIDNKSLVDIINSPQPTQEDKFGAIEALVEKNWPIISKALKFNPTGSIPMQSVKEAVTEQMLGIFPQVTLPDGGKISRNKPLFDTYNKENEVTTFLDATLRNRQAEIFTRAKAIGGIEQIGVDISEAKDIKAPEPTKPKPSKKVRKIKNLSEVNLDNKDVISQTIFNKITNILEQNPKNLTKQLTALIEKDFMKAVKEGMGKISFKAKENEVIVSEEYKTYHALNYENHVKALDVNTIKKNYKTLFDIKKVGREKDKRVNPETGVVTYPGKGIYDIKTNKAKFTKHFIDTSSLDKKTGKPLSARSHYNKILARQKKLAELIAASVTKDAVNKFKIENSNDINVVVEAEIDSFLDTMEKQKGENRTFDTVNYSRSFSKTGINELIHEGIEGDGINSKAWKQIIHDRKLDPNMIDKAEELIDMHKKELDKQMKTEFPKETSDAGLVKQILEDIKRIGRSSIPRGEIFVVKENKHGEIKEKTVVTKLIESLWNEELGITWGKRMAKPLNSFLDKHPQYYRLLRELLTGGERAAYMLVEIFEEFIPETTKIKNTKQVFHKKLSYHRGRNEAEIADGQKGPRLKNPDSVDFTKTNEKEKFNNYLKFFKDLSTWLNTGQNKAHIWLMDELVIHSSIDQSNFFRKAANLLGYQIDENGKPIMNQAVVEEHVPINEIVKIAMGAAIRGNVKEVTVVLKSLLGQMSILEINDPSGKLKASLGIDFYEKVLPKIIDKSLKLKDGHAGIYRLMKHGIDPFSIKLFESEKTIAEEFSVDHLSPDEARQDIINQFEEGKVRYSKANTKKSPLSKDIHKRKTISKAYNFSRSSKNPTKGITVLDFDDTLATTKSLVKFTRPDGTKGALNAEQYAAQYQDLLAQGYKFDFTEFDKVVKAKLAPLFNKALKLQKKFGPENMFILTARPPAAQKAIYDFLKANGLNIPLKNIAALGNSTAEAKALWVANKVGEGYNDFYFADDALQNVKAVKNMLDQFDVKSKVQQAKVKFSKSMNTEFNNILEDITGIDSKKRFSAIKARKRGADKGKFRFFIPPSHEDFVGLIYNFLGKGKKGNQHRDFFEKALIRPLNRAYRELNTAKQAIANDYKSLNKEFINVKKKLTKKTPDGDFTYQDAIRVYLFDKHGHKVPGLTKTDQQKLVDLVMVDTELQTYAETLNIISKQNAYISPGQSWEAGDIRTDLDDATGRIGREQFFTEFNENAEVIFSEENLNKIEAAYGADVVSAIKDILYRTKTGRNRPSGQNKLVNSFLQYLNGSVASTMFFNMRSAVLQQMSMVNFINFADNNVYMAAKAFANQKQYWADWAFIFNSDFMKQRRSGIKTDVNGAELVASLRGAKNTPRALLAKLLQLGFLPTQIGDNMAIATGGATFYRNRINTYLKQGLSQKEAESKAWIDFQVLAEATQQSARPDMVSQQQASPLGKVILAFQNVTSQFNRIGKKAFLDIKNRRITPGNTTQFQSDVSNMSRIGYYFAIQNLVFYSLQSALFLALFEDDEDDDKWLKKKERVINGSIDSVLRGTGVWGAVVATAKNMAIKWHEQREKGYNADESSVLMEMLNVSPPLGIKARKMVNAEKTLNYNKKVIDEMETLDIDNPMWSAVTNYIEAATNAPTNRLYNKTQNVRQSLNNQHEAYQRALMFGGWSQYNLDVENEKMKKIKERAKGNKKKKKSKKKKKVGIL